MFKATTILTFIAFILLLSSCGTHKRMVYFQSENQDSTEVVNSQYTPTYKPDDFLSIVITANDPESAVPFNFPKISDAQSGQSGGYLIDPNGIVNLPVLGKIKLGGLNRTEATELLEKMLVAYLKNPVVNIQIQNFRVTVLGDVSNPGTYTIPNEKFTILELFGISGDLDITGNRKNVLIIREENGIKNQYRIDLTTNEVFTSSVYYLEQNDIVYVEPNIAKRSQGTFWRSSGGILMSLTSLIITTVSIILR